jgi:hypothetical protein
VDEEEEQEVHKNVDQQENLQILNPLRVFGHCVIKVDSLWQIRAHAESQKERKRNKNIITINEIVVSIDDLVPDHRRQGLLVLLSLLDVLLFFDLSLGKKGVVHLKHRRT